MGRDKKQLLEPDTCLKSPPGQNCMRRGVRVESFLDSSDCVRVVDYRTSEHHGGELSAHSIVFQGLLYSLNPTIDFDRAPRKSSSDFVNELAV